jgi:hypothetical protein
MAENDFLSGLLGGVKDAGSSIYSGISGLLGGGEQTPAAGGQMQDSMSMLSQADQRRLMFSTLGELGGVLLAAGARQSPESRAQALAKLGGVGGNVQTQAYNIAQANLMRQQLLEKQQMLESQKQLGELAKDPEAYKTQFGYDPRGIAASQLMGINQQIVAQRATNPYAQETALTQLQANQQTLAQATEKKAALDAFLANPDIDPKIKAAVRVDPSLIGRMIPEAQKPGAAVEQYNLYSRQETAGGRVPLSFFDYETALKKAGQTTINVGDTAEKVMATNAANLLQEQLATGQAAATNLAGSNTIRALLDEGAITGFGAQGIVEIGSTLQKLGITPEDPRIANSRVLMTQLANRSLDAAGRMKGQGAITDPERKLLEQAAGSNIALGEGTIRKILDITDRVDQAALKQGIIAAGVLQESPGIKAAGLGAAYPKPVEPKPYEREALAPDGTKVKAKLGVDGNYYATIDGTRYRIPTE